MSEIAAAVKFDDEYGNGLIQIFPFASNHIEYWRLPSYLIKVRVRGLKPSLQFLRCFGSKILHLEVSLNPKKNYVDQYVNQYCADTVTHITYYFQDRFLFTKRFKNVENLDIVNSWSLRSELPNLVKLFPKVHNLKLSQLYNNTSSIGVFFPKPKISDSFYRRTFGVPSRSELFRA